MCVEGRKGFLHTQQRPGSVCGRLTRVEPPALCPLLLLPIRQPQQASSGLCHPLFLPCLSSLQPKALLSVLLPRHIQAPLGPAWAMAWAFDGLWTSVLQVMPSLPELPNEFLKIKPFLPPCALSTLPSVLCPALESSFLCMTPWDLICLHQEGPRGASTAPTAP